MAFSTGINRVELFGRMYPAFKKQEFEVQTSKTGTKYIKVTITVERPMPSTKQQTEVKKAYDYITCTAYGRTAEFIGTYGKPGGRVFCTGAIQTGKYNNQYTTDIRIDAVHSIDSLAGEDGRKQYQNPRINNDYDNDPAMSDYAATGNIINPDDLPF